MKKIMLITGASRGLGAEIAILAAQRDFAVAINYLNSEAAAIKLAEKIRGEGGQAVTIRADVRKHEEVSRMFKELDEKLGRLDVLVNNAGILTSFRVEQTEATKLEDMFASNVYSAFYCSREAILRMSTKHGGSGGIIINMSSAAARLGTRPGSVAYSSAKGAMDSFNLALAKEVAAEGIRVNAIRPGLIETEIHEADIGIEGMHKLAKTSVPMGRAGSAREVADAALWLASDASSYVTATTIDVTGGR